MVLGMLPCSAVPGGLGCSVMAETPVERGEYPVRGPMGCGNCHTPMGPQGPGISAALGRGGLVFRGPWGKSVAPNITSSPDGLTGHSDDEIKMTVTDRRRPDGSAMLPPMNFPFLARMTPGDLDAIIPYLRTLSPLPDAG